MNSTFPIGARILVDGRDEAIVKAAWPEGTTSHLFPHYVLDIVDGDRGVVVSMSRVGVEREPVCPANLSSWEIRSRGL